ncbi:MAG: hypothetical protein DMG08_14250 [Acidobacteria bacterium]|nr:MAG: hypothetical protein DMG08_14250 [Acidobacteriota bacterium]
MCPVSALGVLWVVAMLALALDARAQDLAVTARHFGGGLDVRHDWSVQLVGTEVTIERSGKSARRVRRVRGRDVNALKRSIEESGFSHLHSRYGCFQCSDNPVCSLMVTLGGVTKEVRLYQYMSSGLPLSSPEAEDVRRFMTVWRAVKRLAGLSGAKEFCP